MSKEAEKLARKLANRPNRKQASPELAEALAWLKRVSERWQVERERRRRSRIRALRKYYRDHGFYRNEEGEL